MTFAKRPLSGPETLGERLRQLREERRLTLAEVARSISVPEKHLAAIEESRHSDLPGLVYAQNFVKKYAEFLSLPAPAAVLRLKEEYQVVRGRRQEQPRLVPRANTDFPWYVRHGRFVMAAVVLALVGSYLVWQAVHLIRPPLLEVLQPAADMSTRITRMTVSGRTESEATVKINNQQTEVGADGTFVDTIDLQPGLNVLKVTASRKYSQTAVVERRVLVERRQ